MHYGIVALCPVTIDEHNTCPGGPAWCVPARFGFDRVYPRPAPCAGMY